MDDNYTKKRIKEVASTFIRHGFKKGVNNPKEFRLALEELGPTFVKIGQILSTRPDILPQEYINELNNLQNNVKPEKYETIKNIIEEDLKKPLGEIFPYFEEKPIASASLAEVHLAKLHTGEEVVVKIQRPNAKESMMGDISILKKLTPVINFTSPGGVIDMKEVVDELSMATEMELDFLNEAENIKRFYENNKDVEFIICPKVYDEYTTNKILVMDYIDGIKIDRVDKLKEEGYDLSDLSTKLAYNYFKQIFEDGFFHADPHPGNLLIHDRKIGYLDFGLMGSLDENVQKRFNDLLIGIANRDVSEMTKSVLKFGLKRGPVDSKKLYDDIEQIYNRYIDESLYEFDLPQIINEVITACKENNIYMPKGITLMAKGLMTLQGVIANLDTELNIMDVAAPYVKNHLMENKLKSMNISKVTETLASSIMASLTLSTKVSELINHILNGRLKAELEFKKTEESINELNRMMNRLIFGLIVAALLVGSSIVINANVGPKVEGMSVFGLAGYLGAAVAGLLLLISIFRSGKL